MTTGFAHGTDALTPQPRPSGSRPVEREPMTPTVRFIDDAGALVALEVEAPILVALDLLDLLRAAGVHLLSFRTLKYGGWTRQRIAITEPDGTAIRNERRLQLQQEILPVLERRTLRRTHRVKP
jgi:hypothetical protein